MPARPAVLRGFGSPSSFGGAIFRRQHPNSHIQLALPRVAVTLTRGYLPGRGYSTMLTIPSFKRLVRFVPKSDTTKVLIGEPESASVDVGAALHRGDDVPVLVWSGSSVLRPGEPTKRLEVADRVLSPVSKDEVGTIRCIGLNYVQHAKEVKCELPTVPTVFLKPASALADPYPAPTILPAATQATDTGDYESELAVIIGRGCKNVPESEAMSHVLGYTAANDISSRAAQFAQSQWCHSKGFDGSCPLGPVLVSKELVPDPSALHVRGLRNGEVLQDCPTADFIFDVPKIVSFLSQGTTLPAGTVIITGTPAGVGVGRDPKVTLRAGDEFAVEILPHIGTLVNVFENEELRCGYRRGQQKYSALHCRILM